MTSQIMPPQLVGNFEFARECSGKSSDKTVVDFLTLSGKVSCAKQFNLSFIDRKLVFIVFIIYDGRFAYSLIVFKRILLDH